MQIDFGAGLESVSDVLELRGEKTLAEAYREAWAFSQAGRTESVEYAHALSPTFLRCVDGTEWWGMMSMFGFVELADGTVALSSGALSLSALAGGAEVPVERVSSEADLVPAAQRLLKRILDGVPGLRAWIEMALSLKGLDLSGLV